MIKNIRSQHVKVEFPKHKRRINNFIEQCSQIRLEFFWILNRRINNQIHTTISYNSIRKLTWKTTHSINDQLLFGQLRCFLISYEYFCTRQTYISFILGSNTQPNKIPDTKRQYVRIIYPKQFFLPLKHHLQERKELILGIKEKKKFDSMKQSIFYPFISHETHSISS